MKIRFLHTLLLLSTAAILVLGAQKNPYKVLGLQQNASDEQIKQKFRELSKKYHPDINKDPKAEDFYAEITSAYRILSDPNEKQKYFDEVERQQYKQQSNSFNWQSWGNSGYQQQSKLQNYKKKWHELYQKQYKQSYSNSYNNKKSSYKPVGSSKLGWIKDKISGMFFGGGISDIIVYAVIIIFIVKVFGSMVHVQMGR